ncbi:MAG: hypothetical protein IJ088_01885, partial [Clostridia bacterium]|nr:hypothetical protein [Clostridia bacterium]
QLRLMRIMNRFLQAEADMRGSSPPRVAAANAAWRACLPEEGLQLEALRERLDELERKIQSGEIASARPARGTTKKAVPESDSPVSEKAVSMDPGVEPTAEAVYKAMMQEIRKSMPMLYALMVPGRLAHEENGLFTVVFNAKTGGLNVGMLNSRERNEQVATALSVAAGHPCTFRAALEGTVEEKDQRILDAKEEARRQAEENLHNIIGTFGRDKVEITDME